MKKLISLTSLATLFILFSIPALAQENDAQPDVATDQYPPDMVVAEAAAEQAVRNIVSEGGDANGAAAYSAALNAARETGVDEETAEVVAATAVADVSEEPETNVPSGEPGTSGSPEEPGTSRSPGEPGASGSPGEPEASGSPGEPEASGSPGEPEIGEPPRKPDITELPDTGGGPAFVLGAGLLILGAGLLARRILF